MASNTPNLNLYKKDPIADGNDTFNVGTMLNENWDKIDAAHAAHLAQTATQEGGVHDFEIESGTFTPILGGHVVDGAHTYAKQVGKYHKIGNRVFCDIIIALSAKDAAMSGNLYILGLPFVVKNVAGLTISGNVGHIANINIPVNYNAVSALTFALESSVYLYVVGNNQVLGALTDVAISNTSEITISLNYEI